MDAFLATWWALDEDETRAGSSILISMPRIGRYLRHYRNAAILDLHRQGHSIQEIQHFISSRFREAISDRHVARIIDRREGHDSAD